MQNELTYQSLGEFRKKFYALNDATIDHIHIDLSGSRQQRRIIVTITTRNIEEEIKDQGESILSHQHPLIWINLTLTFEGILEMHIKQIRNYGLNVIDELSIDFFNGEIYVGLMSIKSSYTPADYQDQLQSPILMNIISQKCFWSVATISPTIT
jgi:hypothetical protein